MSRSKLISVDDKFFSILKYATSRLQKNAGMYKPPPLTRVTKVMSEESLIDGNIIIFNLPNGNKFKIRKRL